MPVVRLETGLDGPAAAIDLTLQVFRLVEFFGAERGIDPGRPGVRDFGRRLYGIGVPNLCEDGLSDFERLALRRKFGSAVPRAKSRQNSLRRFVSRMLRQEFGAVVFGYGALCDDGRRHEGPAPEIGSMLAGLIGRGVSVGVAAGRGDPARAQLTKLLPGRCRAGVLVGYDGAGTGGLSDRAADPGAPGSLFGLIKERLPAGRKILCIGGGRPGEGELLGAEYSLSVDEASDDPSRCWNLLPAGKRGAAGLVVLDAIYGARGAGPGFLAGGSCANVLTILSYLGWDSYPAARLGSDPEGRRVIEDMESWDVRTEFLRTEAGLDTPRIVERAPGGGRAHGFSFRCSHGRRLPRRRPYTLGAAGEALARLPAAGVFYFDRADPGALKIALRMKAGGAAVFFEPHKTSGGAVFERCLRAADVVKSCGAAAGPRPPLEIQTLGAAGLRYRARGAGWARMRAFPSATWRTRPDRATGCRPA